MRIDDIIDHLKKQANLIELDTNTYDYTLTYAEKDGEYFLTSTYLVHKLTPEDLE